MGFMSACTLLLLFFCLSGLGLCVRPQLPRAYKLVCVGVLFSCLFCFYGHSPVFEGGWGVFLVYTVAIGFRWGLIFWNCLPFKKIEFFFCEYWVSSRGTYGLYRGVEDLSFKGEGLPTVSVADRTHPFFLVGLLLNLPLMFLPRMWALFLWGHSERVYFTEAELFFGRCHTRVEFFFFIWSFANRLFFLFALSLVFGGVPIFFKDACVWWSLTDLFPTVDMGRFLFGAWIAFL